MSILVSPGQTSPVYVYVSANKLATEGQKTFYLEIQSGDETKQLPLTATLTKGGIAVDGLKKALQVGLIIFVVLLVVLGLVIGYNKMKENSNNDLDSEDESSQTYY
jgi:hypothetical protein